MGYRTLEERRLELGSRWIPGFVIIPVVAAIVLMMACIAWSETERPEMFLAEAGLVAFVVVLVWASRHRGAVLTIRGADLHLRSEKSQASIALAAVEKVEVVPTGIGEAVVIFGRNGRQLELPSGQWPTGPRDDRDRIREFLGHVENPRTPG